MLGLAADTEINETHFKEGMVLVTADQNTANTANAGLVTALRTAAKVVLGKEPEDMTAFLTTHSFIANDKLPDLTAAETSVTALITETGLTKETLVEGVKTLKAESALGKAAVEARRAEVIRL